MRERFKITKAALKLVLKKPLWFFATALLAAGFFGVLILLNNLATFASVLRISWDPLLFYKVFANQVDMIADVAGLYYLLGIVLVAILAALNFVLLFFKLRITSDGKGGSGIGGSFLGFFGGALGAACPACGSTLLSVLGISSGLAVFPLRGFEFILLSLVLLLASLYYTSRSLLLCGVLPKTRGQEKS